MQFPKKLALALEQGEVVLGFVLDRQGRISELRVQKSSGFSAFDREALRAFRKVGPLGPPPAALSTSAGRLSVVAPYYFRNPLIR